MTIPRATYRLQLHRGFGFDDAAGIAPYLAQLGISHVYTSPFLQARPGSNHGYDIVDHARLNPEVGDEAAFRRMTDAFAAHGLGLIVDVVPNHMAVGGSDNPLWLDVLEWGQESRYAGWFDIDWEPHNRYLIGKVLVPFLGDQYGVEIAAGKLRLQFDAERGEIAVWAYGTHKLPICPLHYGEILGDATPTLEALGDDFAALADWRPDVLRRADELKQQLCQLASQDPASAAELAAALERLNAGDQPDAPRPLLDALIQQQHWRASHFRVAGDDINYRRFFNVNELAGLRIELPAVFEHVHQLVLELVRQGRVQGLRVDHIDGLLDPAAYLIRLREASRAAGAPDDFSLVVEKILAADEDPPDNWPIHGTTGYEFGNLCLQLLVDRRGEDALTAGYQDFIDSRQAFPAVLRDSKLRVMDHEMAAELNVLARAAARIARLSPLTADFTSALLLRAIRAVIACMPVYRTYVHTADVPSIADLQRLGVAVESARTMDREIDPSVFTFLERLLSGQLAEPRSGYVRHKVLWCAMRLQQYSGPVMAKGQEDTAFYRYNRFIALNEVGSEPSQFGLDLEGWHQAMVRRARTWPHSLSATSTHDSKRGEDLRARLAVLAEIPGQWLEHAGRWRGLLAELSDTAKPFPDRNDLYCFLQMLAGCCPPSTSADTPDDDPELTSLRERLLAATLKSMREAKVHTTWTRPDEDYEGGMLALVDRVLRPRSCPEFWATFSPFLQKLAALGVANSLAMITLKLTAPGIPDIYQGCEDWNFSMMDPDNRRPVVYPQVVAQASWKNGSVKRRVTRALLQLRRARESLFRGGEYQAIYATGKHRQAACIYLRKSVDDFVIVVVGRFPAQTAEGWQDTHFTLPPECAADSVTDLLSGRQCAGGTMLRLQDLLGELPVAVLAASSP